MIIRDENSKSWKSQKKDLKEVFMSKSDCYSIHQGRHSPETATNGNGALRKEKIKFWGLVSGLVVVLCSLVSIIISKIS